MSRTFLGQNFLIDVQVQNRIVEAFHPAGAFAEIGPGEGAITEKLLTKHGPFLAIEKDPMLAEKLRKRLGSLRIWVGDFCDWDFQLDGKPVHRFSLVGNLPYESGSRILASVAQHADQIEHFLFMLQREVVERICASSRTSDFGSLSVLLQGQFEMKALDIVAPESFSPPPRVFSQLVMGTIRTTNRHPLSDRFQKFVQRSFAQKRKTLKNVWKGLLTPEKVAEIFKKFDFKETQRAEEIDLDLWPQLFKEADL